MMDDSPNSQANTQILLLIQHEIVAWCELVLALTLTLILLQVSILTEQSYALVLIPLFLLHLKSLIQSLVSKESAYSIVESSCGISTMLMGLLYTFSLVNFFLVLFPPCLDLGFSMCLKRNKNPCQLLSKMIFSVLKYTQMATLLSVGLKQNDLIDWDWYTVLWPVMLLIIFMLFISAAQCCFLFSSFYDDSSLSVLFFAWLFYSVTSFTLLSIFLFEKISEFLTDGSNSIFYPTVAISINSSVFLLLTIASRHQLS